MRCPSRKLSRVFLDQIIRQDSYGLRPYFNNPPDWILDVGANVGYFSLLCRMLFPRARIIAVEPCLNTHRFLHHNTRGLEIERRHVALAEQAVDIQIGADCGSHYCTPGQAVPGLKLSQMVEQWQLDLGARYMIKIDCEGGEKTLLNDPLSLPLILGSCHAALEIHYQCEKWPHAAPRQKLDHLVNVLRQRWRADSLWRQARKGGELVLRTEKP